MIDALYVKVKERESRLEALDRERIVVAAELAAYRDAVQIVGASLDSRPHAQAPQLDDDDAQRKGRRPNAFWQKLMQLMANNYPEPFDIDMMMDAARTHTQVRPTRGNIRSQMHAYGARELVTRVSDGVFRLTPKGFLELELVAPGPAPSPGEAPDPFALDTDNEVLDSVEGSNPPPQSEETAADPEREPAAQ